MMKCPNCNNENRDDAKFCKHCGTKLEIPEKKPGTETGAKPTAETGSTTPAKADAPVCPKCNAVLKSDAKFCKECGTPVAANAAPSEETVISEENPNTPVTQAPKNERETANPTAPEETEQETAAAPKSEPVSEQPPASYCKHCGAPLKSDAKYCPRCGKPVNESPKPTKPTEPTKKPFVIILWILIILLLLGGALFALVKMEIITLPFGDQEHIISAPTVPDDEDAQSDETEATETPDNQTDDEEDTDEEDLSAELEAELAPISDKVAAGEEKINGEDYSGANADLTDALTAYADLAKEYDSQSATDTISPLADDAFALYTTSTLKQVESWESQPVTAPLYTQIDGTLEEATNFATQLRESNLDIDTAELDQNYADFPGRYKEKYILTFNDLRTGDEWSRTTAWQYMQDAASVGLVDKENPDDPLTLRHAYAYAWITQRDISEGMNDGSMSAADSISYIVSYAKTMDYNPVLMRDLALYYDMVDDSTRSSAIKSACTSVYNYLANEENIYIDGSDLFVPGKSSSNASSTIALNDFWYFNDFGEYSPSDKNGVSPEGRKYIRTVFEDALKSL